MEMKQFIVAVLALAIMQGCDDKPTTQQQETEQPEVDNLPVEVQIVDLKVDKALGSNAAKVCAIFLKGTKMQEYAFRCQQATKENNKKPNIAIADIGFEQGTKVTIAQIVAGNIVAARLGKRLQSLTFVVENLKAGDKFEVAIVDKDGNIVKAQDGTELKDECTVI